MQIVQWVPGIVATPAIFGIPAWAPDIDAIVEVEVKRLPQAVAAHAGTVAGLAHTATVVPVVHAGCAVDPHADHGHNFITQGVGGAVGAAIGWDAVGPISQMEDAGAAALHTLPGGGATGIQNFTIPAHVVNPQPNNHAGVDILAAVGDHTQAQIAAALVNHTAIDPDIGAVIATRDTARTIHLDTSTQIADIVILTYHEVGDRVLVA